jgi:lipoprotein-releasing system ATP-binding protein
MIHEKRKVFEVVEKLECAYPIRGKVLEVPELDIYAGEIVVIIGNSGAGKSTLIETLGLMTDTLSKENQNTGKGKVIFYPNGNKDRKVEIPQVWKQGKNGDRLTEVRKESYNFIFQDNNLMVKLKNDENVILADLIDGTKDYKTSKEDSEKIFEKLRISPKVGRSFPMDVSGGERQRVAFARGIQPKFTVLFGDEPTGNLDEKISETLMKELQKEIPEDSPDKAAILVSHNIDLSLKFADRIIILTKEETNDFYQIHPEYTFKRKSRNSKLWAGKFPFDGNLQGGVLRKFPANNTLNLHKKETSLTELHKTFFENIPGNACDYDEKEFDDKIVNLRCLKDYITHILEKNIQNTEEEKKKEKENSKYHEDKENTSTHAEKDKAGLRMLIKSIYYNNQEEDKSNAEDSEDSDDNENNKKTENPAGNPKKKKKKNKTAFAVKNMTLLGMLIMSFYKWIAKIFRLKGLLTRLTINQYFSQLLFRKECEQLAGVHNRNLRYMIISIFITFLIIGLSNGQIYELKNELMNDPFTLTLDVLHRGGEMQKETRKILKEILADQETMNYYHLQQITEFDRNYLTFYNFEHPDEDQYYLGRSMNIDDPLLDKILDPEINKNADGRKFNSAKDIGLIVTKDLMDALEYDCDSPVIYIKMKDDESGEYIKIALPIIAFVDQLPGRRKNYFLYTSAFYDYYIDKSISFPFMRQKNIKIAARIDRNKINEFKAELEKALGAIDDIEIPNYRGYRKVEVDSNKYFRDKIFEFIIYPKSNNRNLYEQQVLADTLLKVQQFASYLNANNLKAGKDVFRMQYFDLPIEETKTIVNDEKERGNISFLFEDPSRIREFAQMFTDRTIAIDHDKKEGLLLDIGKVNSMFIFSKVTWLTYSILVILIIIIVYANMQFISNLLDMHLYKIRRNVGTLMAFGINIKTIYHFLILSFVLYSFILAIFLVIIIGYFVIEPFTGYTFSLFSGFNTIDIYMALGAFALIFSGSYLVYFFAKLNYFRKTPSQLIYNRMGNNYWKELFRRFIKTK